MNISLQRSKSFFLVAFATFMFFANTGKAQIKIMKDVIANGGVTFATGTGGIGLGSTAGQSIVGTPLNNGGINGTTLNQGFWHVYQWITGVQEVESEIPVAYMLDQNYPNPFNPSTRIRFTIPSGNMKEIHLNVYNALGILVKTLIDEPMGEGTYDAALDGTGFISGVYVYELRVGSQLLTKKMILSK